MRPPLELLDLPYSFMQLRLLMPQEFVREAKARGLTMTSRELEALHRFKILVPLFRVRRDGRLIAALARRRDPAAWQGAGWHPNSRLDLDEARREGRLFDPAAEGFVARRRLRRKVADIEYSSSEYLYSHHQMLLLPLVRATRPYLRASRTGDLAHIEVSKWWRAYAIGRAMQLREVAIALSALEAVYYPRVVRRLSYSTEDEYERYTRWVRGLGVRKMLGWLGVDANWLKDTGSALLDMADNIDPLGEWLDVVREAHPDRWKKLKGEARNAIDMRIGAEMLLGYYEDLARRRQAKPLEQHVGRWRGPFDSRLKPQGSVDRVLTAFDLSPHPSLVLVVEGATELTIVPRVMAMFGIRTDEDFISVQDAGGVGRDLNSLVAYALAPRIDRKEQGEYLALTRPPTRLLAIMDAERPMATAASREKRRKGWVERILLSIPAEYRTDEVRRNPRWHGRGEHLERAGPKLRVCALHRSSARYSYCWTRHSFSATKHK